MTTVSRPRGILPEHWVAVSYRDLVLYTELNAYIGVGLANVFLNSPLTLLGGERYSFSSISGVMEIVVGFLSSLFMPLAVDSSWDP